MSFFISGACCSYSRRARSKNAQAARRGIALLDLLLVLTISGIVLGLVTFAANGFKQRQDFLLQAQLMAEVLEKAQRHARANAAPVWVAFYQADAQQALWVAAVKTRDGTRQASAAQTISLQDGGQAYPVAEAGSNLEVLTQPVRLNQIRLAQGTSIVPAASSAQMLLRPPGSSAPTTFGHLIEFRADGGVESIEASDASTIECRVQSYQTVFNGSQRGPLEKSILIDRATGYVRME